MNDRLLGTATKFMQPVIDNHNAYTCMSQKEKVECIKKAYGLSHGKGKSSKRKKRK